MIPTRHRSLQDLESENRTHVITIIVSLNLDVPVGWLSSTAKRATPAVMAIKNWPRHLTL